MQDVVFATNFEPHDPILGKGYICILPSNPCALPILPVPTPRQPHFPLINCIFMNNCPPSLQGAPCFKEIQVPVLFADLKYTEQGLTF